MANIMKDAPENNKFQGLKYYAIDEHNIAISVGVTPDEVYYDAVSKGCRCPIVIRSNTVIKTKDKPTKKK